MIRLESASKRFGDIQALAPIDFGIAEGEWHGVFGRNGSGKSSLLRMLIGLSRPTTGRVLLHGVEPTPEDWRRFRRKLGYMPERIAFFENLTGEKTLRYFARLKGVGESEVARILDRVGLSHAAKRKLGGYSKGMLQRLNFAQALLGEPSVLVVDEPIEGLDAHAVQEFFGILKEVPGRTVVFSSHRLPLITRFVDRISVLCQGEVKAAGTEDELHQKLNLPVRVILQPAASVNGHLMEAVGRLSPASLVNRGGKLVASVSQAEKLRFLAGLDALSDSFRDVRIEEPSLEEVLLETS